MRSPRAMLNPMPDPRLWNDELGTRALAGDLEQGRENLAQIEREVTKLWAAGFFLFGARDDANEAVIAALESYVAGAGARLLARAEAGDQVAARELRVSSGRMLSLARGETPLSDVVGSVGQFGEDVAEDIREGADKVATASTPIAISLAVVAVVVAAIYFLPKTKG